MALLQNFVLHAQLIGRFTGASATATDGGNARSQLGIRAQTMMAPFISEAGWVATASLPEGYEFGNGWLPAKSNGAVWRANIGSATTPAVVSLGALNLAAGRNIDGTTSALFTVPAADMVLLYFTVGSTTFEFSGSLNLVGAVYGVGATAATFDVGPSAATALATVAGTTAVVFDAAGAASLGIFAVGSTTATFSLADADLTLIGVVAGGTSLTLTPLATIVGGLVAGGSTSMAVDVGPSTLLGVGVTASGVSITFALSGTMRAVGSLAGSITPFTELSPQSLSNAVWSALDAANDVAGTMGAKLNDAGSASNPWTEILESGYTAAELLQILTAVAAGKTAIIDNGGGAATVTFRNIGDTKDVVVADMQGSARETITLNP